MILTNCQLNAEHDIINSDDVDDDVCDAHDRSLTDESQFQQISTRLVHPVILFVDIASRESWDKRHAENWF